ncbi:MAG: hypothetical protein B6D36_12535 [Planctomycetes bacterium UTPLA1]|nr:MAG: hypothetical protein B6D36_12535 [Planctomycetes bacterium UTPLA1]
MNPLLCERCGRNLESDDAISIIEGVCCACRRASADARTGRLAAGAPRTPPPATPPRPRPHMLTGQAAIPPRQPVNPPRPTIVTPMASVEPGATHRTRARRRDLLIGVAFGMILTVGATGFMMWKNSEPIQLRRAGSAEPVPVRVTVKPTWAEVKLDEKPIESPETDGVLSFTIPAEGDELHWLSVSADGYHAVRRPLTVYGGVGELTIELIRKPISVSLKTNPPAADVWIDNQLRGTTPVELTLLPWEKTKVTLKRPGYASFTQEIIPPERGSKLDLEFPLVPNESMLHVASDPLGAIIAVNGRVVGAAPIDVPLDSAKQGDKLSISATLAGYAQATTQFVVPGDVGNEPLSTLLKLTRPKAELSIVTVPPGAEIRLDGRPIGRAPIVAPFTPEEIGNRVVVEGVIPGTHVGKMTVQVPPAGEQQRVVLTLAPSGKRVTYVVLSPTGIGTDHVLLMDHLVEQIHRMEPSQRFDILICTSDGVRQWPDDGAFVAASSAEKIRAYDVARSIRPSGNGPINDVVPVIRRLQPDIVWLFAAGELTREALDPIAEAVRENRAVINMVKVEASGDEGWLRQWTRLHDGVVSFIGPAVTRSVARDSSAID